MRSKTKTPVSKLPYVINLLTILTGQFLFSNKTNSLILLKITYLGSISLGLQNDRIVENENRSTLNKLQMSKT